MAAGLPEEKWKEVYANLKTFHDKAYTVIDAAIKLEEEDKKDQALQKYEEGLGLIDLALELRVECPSNPDLTWEKGCVMLQKMRKTKKELLGRIADIQVRQPPDPNLLPPPSYDEAMSLSPSLPHVPPTTPVLFPPYVNGGGVGGGGPSFPSTAGASSLPPSGAGASSLPPSGAGASSGGGQPASFMTYQQLGEALNNLKVETDMQSAQVIYTHDNVRLYFISTEGVVSSSSEPSVLRILQLEDGTDKEPLFYLQVGDWFYPLVPNVSPCFRSEYGAFILPDVHGEDVSPYGNSHSTSMTVQRYPFLSKERSAVGIMLPPDADKSVYNLLEDILHCIVTTEPIAPPRHRVKRDETRSAAVSRSIVSDKHRHKKRSHRDPEDGEKKSHRRHRRHHRRHHDDEDVVDDGESVTSSSKDSHRRHRGKKHHGYDLLPKSRHSKHLYGVPVFGNYRTVLGVKPSEMVHAEEEIPQKLLGEKKEKEEREVEKKEKEVEKKEKGEKEEEEEEDSDESSSSEGSSDSEDTVEEAEEVALDPKEEKRRRKEEYKEEKRRRKEEYKRSISKSSSSSGGQGKRRGKRFVLASKYRAPGAQYISSGLVRGAEKASEYINSSTPRLLEKITPDPTPRQVSPGLAKGAEVARNVTGTAVVVTGYVANKVGSATMALGRYLAPHIQKGGTRLAGVAGVDEATAAARVEGAMTLAAGAVEGFSTVYTGLEQAGSILGNSLTNNTVHIVEHKYGQPMGQVTGHTLHSIGNAYAASQNFRIFTPKNLAKKTAKDAGKAFVEDFRAELRNHNSMPQQNHHSLMQQQNYNSTSQQQNFNSMPPQYQMNGDQKPPLDKPGPSKS